MTSSGDGDDASASDLDDAGTTHDERADDADAADTRQTVPARIPTLHPPLVAAYSVLTLWSSNVFEVPVDDVVAILWPVVAASLVVWVVLAGVMWGLREPNPIARGGLVASVAGGLFLVAGRVMPGLGPVVGLGVVAVAGIVTALVAMRMAATAMRSVTIIVNVFAIVAVGLALFQLQPVLTPSRAEAVQIDFDGATSAARDIWYIIPDRYPREDTLEAEFDFDNAEFEQFLSDRDFTIQDQSRANYPKTAHSLAATWNLETVQNLVPDPPADGSDWRPLYDLLDDHLLGRLVTDAGFDYVHLGSWWTPTQTAASATEVRNLDATTEFESVWVPTTGLRWLTADDEDEEFDGRRHVYDVTAFQLDELDRLVSEPHDRPRLVLAHVTLPHEPYVFDVDGSYVDAATEQSRSRDENTVNQTRYLNTRLEALVDRLVTGDPERDPIIVIQSDEGPHPDIQYETRVQWLDVSTAERAEKLRTFSAWHLPGIDEAPPADTTGVNTWRIILDHYFGTDFGPVDDQVWVFPNEDNLYEFHEVTDEFD